jgi:hypothetical protein
MFANFLNLSATDSFKMLVSGLEVEETDLEANPKLS